MKNIDDAICVGCGKTAGELEEYSDDNPVQEDGTYENNKFVCTNCYVKLIPRGMDTGTPFQVQNHMIAIARKEGNK